MTRNWGSKYFFERILDFPLSLLNSKALPRIQKYFFVKKAETFVIKHTCKNRPPFLIKTKIKKSIPMSDKNTHHTTSPLSKRHCDIIFAAKSPEATEEDHLAQPFLHDPDNVITRIASPAFPPAAFLAFKECSEPSGGSWTAPWITQSRMHVMLTYEDPPFQEFLPRYFILV